MGESIGRLASGFSSATEGINGRWMCMRNNMIQMESTLLMMPLQSVLTHAMTCIHARVPGTPASLLDEYCLTDLACARKMPISGCISDVLEERLEFEF